MRRATQRVPLILLGLGLAACVTRGDIEEIKENQKKILEQMEKGVRPRARPKRPRGPDPKDVFAIPIDGANFRGPADAWVTLVEVSDFQ